MSEAAMTDAKIDIAKVAPPQNIIGVTSAAPAPSPEQSAAPEKLPIIDAHATELLTPLDTLLTRQWGGFYEREALMQFVNPNNVKQTKKGVGFTLDSGIEVLWSTSLLRNPDGSPVEFIGVPGKLFGKTQFDQDAANAVVMLAISKGWQSIKLHGPDEHKEMMWLAAQKVGMPVSNFVPNPDSKIWKKLEQENPEAYQATMRRMLGGPQTPEENPAAPKKTPADLNSRFTQAEEDPFEQALQQRINQTANPQEASGLKQILDDVKAGKLELDAREKANFLQKIDSPILLTNNLGKAVTPVESALAMVDQKQRAEKTPAAQPPEKQAKPGERIEPTLNMAGTAPKPPEPK